MNKIEEWKQFIEDNKNSDELEKLTKVNDYINNSTLWIEDKILWRKKDHWATPIETLNKTAGDCEDFAILKYYTLIAMGVPEDRLYITYTKYKNIAHMVLCYFYPDALSPQILDNINNRIRLGTERKDLTSVYGFNKTEMIVLKHFMKNKSLGSANRITLWVNLQERAKE